jgi:hypothetical protein
MTAISPQSEPRTDLAAMSIRELLAELTRLQDRANAEPAGHGTWSLPGQTHRRAELERRERRILAELHRRRPTHPDDTTFSGAAT